MASAWIEASECFPLALLPFHYKHTVWKSKKLSFLLSKSE